MIPGLVFGRESVDRGLEEGHLDDRHIRSALEDACLINDFKGFKLFDDRGEVVTRGLGARPQHANLRSVGRVVLLVSHALCYGHTTLKMSPPGLGGNSQ